MIKEPLKKTTFPLPFFILLVLSCLFCSTLTSKVKEPLWGNEYTTSEASAQLKKLLVSMCESSEQSYYSELDIFSFDFGPCIYPRLIKIDPWLKSYVTPMNKKRLDDDRTFIMWDSFFEHDRINAMKNSPALKQLACTFSNGKIRPATAKEREYVSYMTYLRKEMPLSVIEKDSAVLLLFFDRDRITIEMLSDW